MTKGRFAAAILIAVFLLAALPTAAAAWTPGTHVFLGDSVLANLAQLPFAVAN